MGSPTGGPDSGTAWAATFAALLVLTIGHGAPLISIVALKAISADLATARAGPSAASPLAYIGAAVGGIAAGWLADRVGFRAIIMFGGLMVALGLVISSLGSPAALYAGHGVFIGLLGTSCMFSPLMTYVSLWFERKRGAAIALISSGQAISGTLWPMLIDYGVSHVGWQVTMQAFAALAAAVIPLVAFRFLPAPPGAATRTVSATKPSRAANRGQAAGPVMVLLTLAIFCCCVPMNVPLQHIVAFCGDAGIPSRRGAAMLTVLLGVALLSRQFWGWLADRLGAVRTLLWSSLAQLVALSGFLLTQDEAALFLVSSAFGFAFSGLLPAYVMAVREYFPASEASWRVPTVLLGGYAGMAVGGWGAGAVFDGFGSYGPAFTTGILFNLLNLLLVGLLMMIVQTRRAIVVDGTRAGTPAGEPMPVGRTG